MPIPDAQCPPDPKLCATPGNCACRKINMVDPVPNVRADWFGWKCKKCGAEWWLHDGSPFDWIQEHKECAR